MNHRELVETVAARCGARPADIHRVMRELVSEVQRQLVLGEEVCVTGLGRFRCLSTRSQRGVSNLPGLKGKYVLPRAKKRIKFVQSVKATREISSNDIVSAFVSGAHLVSEKARKIPMAKKKGKHITVDVPREVESVTINVVDQQPKKKGESSSKSRLLG
jgi:nucleoid DNA-binding protein